MKDGGPSPWRYLGPVGRPEAGMTLTTSTIITMSPNDLVATIHNRMPVILESGSTWLSSGDKRRCAYGSLSIRRHEAYRFPGSSTTLRTIRGTARARCGDHRSSRRLYLEQLDLIDDGLARKRCIGVYEDGIGRDLDDGSETSRNTIVDHIEIHSHLRDESLESSADLEHQVLNHGAEAFFRLDGNGLLLSGVHAENGILETLDRIVSDSELEGQGLRTIQDRPILGSPCIVDPDRISFFAVT